MDRGYVWRVETQSVVMVVNGHGLPPGFRFHPTDEELITYYLAPRACNMRVSGGVEMAEVDLKRCEPWEVGAMVGEEDSREWYLLSLRDRKYPTGLRTNRATQGGYWKATGKDRHVLDSHTKAVIGFKKTLVFYHGRAPRGLKTNWAMHEYRLHLHSDWVLCRIYLKPSPTSTPPPHDMDMDMDMDLDIISALWPTTTTITI